MKSIKEIRKICQPSSVLDDESFWSKFFLRHISIYFTKLFLYLPTTANQISLLMILMGITGGFFLALGGYINGLICALFLQLFLTFDCVDGEIARYKDQSSLKGKYLDLIANDIVHASIFLGLTIGMFNSNYKIFNIFLSYNNLIFIFGISAVIFPFLHKIAVFYEKEICGESIILSEVVLKNKKSKRLKSFLNALIFPTSIINITSVCAVFNLLPFMLFGYGIIFPFLFIISINMRYKRM